MENIKNKKVLFSIALSSIVALIILFVGSRRRGEHLFAGILQLEQLRLGLGGFLFLLGSAIVVGIFAEKYSVKKILPFVLIFVGLWIVGGFAAAKYLGVNLFFIRESLIVGAVMTAVHLKKLWLIDTELTENLVRVASTGHILEGKSADLRIESGLKLLESVLPFSEAIVFHFDESGELNPIGRSRNEATVNSTGFAPNRMARKYRAMRARL
jgi:uncharacterized membrane protein (Fun14 family)